MNIGKTTASLYFFIQPLKTAYLKPFFYFKNFLALHALVLTQVHSRPCIKFKKHQDPYYHNFDLAQSHPQTIGDKLNI